MSAPPVIESVPVEPEPKSSLTKQLFSRGRLLLFAIALAIELAIYFGAMAYPIDPAQQQALQEQAQALANSTIGQGPVAAVVGIFENNLRVALLEMIPAVGAILFGVVSFTTGQVIQVEAISFNIPGPVLGLSLFVFPFAIVELSSYAVAVTSGIMLIVAWRRKTLHNELRVFLLEAVVVVVAVLAAAGMETMLEVNVAISFALWVPTALAAAMIVVYSRRGRG
jgi:hypothetical protein